MESETISCANCAAQMPRILRFCRRCGHRLPVSVDQQAATEILDAARSSEPVMPNPRLEPVTTAAAQGASRQPRKRGHLFFWPILGLILLFAVADMKMERKIVFRRQMDTELPWTKSLSESLSERNLCEMRMVDAERMPGAMVLASLPPGSPLDQAGIVGGDVIVGLGGVPVKNVEDLRRALAKAQLGQPLEVIFVRDGEMRKSSLVPVPEEEIERLDDLQKDRPKGYWGVSNFERVWMPALGLFGVRLGNVRSNRPAEIAGLQSGDVVLAVDNVPIRTAEELVARIERTPPGSVVSVAVFRQGNVLRIPVKVGHDD